MRRLLIAVATVTLLAASSGPGIAQMERPGDEPREETRKTIIGDGIVVPGERIGPLRLGMTAAQMTQVMPPGFEREVFQKENIILYEWRYEGVWVSVDETTRQIRLISVFGTASYQTSKGVVLLHPESRMEAAYGRDYKRYEYPEDRLNLVRYVPLGLQFGIVNYPSQKAIHGRIFSIGIFAPGKEPPLTKQPSK